MWKPRFFPRAAGEFTSTRGMWMVVGSVLTKIFVGFYPQECTHNSQGIVEKFLRRKW